MKDLFFILGCSVLDHVHLLLVSTAAPQGTGQVSLSYVRMTEFQLVSYTGVKWLQGFKLFFVPTICQLKQ